MRLPCIPKDRASRPARAVTAGAALVMAAALAAGAAPAAAGAVITVGQHGAVVTAGQHGAVATADQHGRRSARLTMAIRRVMREASIPGSIVGVWQRGERPYVRAFGVRSLATRRPMSVGLSMRIGSETKTFTVTALLQLVDRHFIRLDDPISRFVRGVPDGRHITLRELAEMRSGLFSYTADPAWARAVLSHPERRWRPRQLLRYAFRHPPLFRPGTRFNYSNTNTILLGLVVEKVSGLPLGTFIRRDILRPQHLAHTIFPAGARIPAPHAQGYTKQTLDGKLANATRWNPSWGWAAGAMISDLADLHAWARDVATGTLLSPATQRQRERFLPTGLAGTGYGLGLFVNHGWVGHNGSLPGYQSLTLYLPRQRATLVVLVNSDIDYRGSELPTLLGTAITKIITPRHVYTLPAAS